MKTPKKTTGPATDRGKQISSQNAAKHNCTSTQLIVGDEVPAEFDALLDSLTAEYQPETEMQKTTVMQAARAVWHLARVNREFDKSQQNLYKEQANMYEWNAAQQAEFERMSRYRTRAERAHGRAWQGVEALRKLHLQAEQRAFWENLQQERLDLSKQRLQLSTARLEHTVQQKEQTQNEKAPKEKEKDKAAKPVLWHEPMHLLQEIEIRLLDGVVSHRIYPHAEDCSSAQIAPTPAWECGAASNSPTASPPNTPGSTNRTSPTKTTASSGNNSSTASMPGALTWP